MHEVLIGVCAHILLKGYIHSTAISVQIFPACNLFSPVPQKCLKYLSEITQWLAFSFLKHFHFSQSTHQQLRQRSTFSQLSVLPATLCTMFSPSGLLFILFQGNILHWSWVIDCRRRDSAVTISLFLMSHLYSFIWMVLAHTLRSLFKGKK